MIPRRPDHSHAMRDRAACRRPRSVAGVAGLSHSGAGQPPVFRSAVELVRVDVQVVAGAATRCSELGLDDFEVHIDGDRRRVVTSELVRFAPEDDIRTAVRPVRTPG